MVEKYRLSVLRDEVVIITNYGQRVHPLSKLGGQLKLYQPIKSTDIVENPNEEERAITEDVKESDSKQDNVMESKSELDVVEETNSPKTLNDLRKILMDNITKIQSGDLPLDKAREIVAHSNSIINITKVELEYRKYKYQKAFKRIT